MDMEAMMTALAGLTPLEKPCLVMDRPGRWRVLQKVEVGGDGFLTSVCGHGGTPREAVAEHWRQLTEGLPAGGHVRMRLVEGARRARWDGTGWRDVRDTDAPEQQGATGGEDVGTADRKVLGSAVEAAMEHAREHGYRPGPDDTDMLETGISEASMDLDLGLTDAQEKAAVELWRDRL